MHVKIVLMVLGFHLALVPLAFASGAKEASPNAQAPRSKVDLTSGLGTYLNIDADFAHKNGFDTNSWFATGHFVSEGHTINFLYHLMILNVPVLGPQVQSLVSVTDETTGWYSSGESFRAQTKDAGEETALSFHEPNATFGGTVKNFSIQAQTKDAKIDVVVQGPGPVLYNGGTGMFPLLGMNVAEYSLPQMTAKGSITIEGHDYPVNGIVWFDRQWNQTPRSEGGSWM